MNHFVVEASVFLPSIESYLPPEFFLVSQERLADMLRPDSSYLVFSARYVCQEVFSFEDLVHEYGEIEVLDPCE